MTWLNKQLLKNVLNQQEPTQNKTTGVKFDKQGATNIAKKAVHGALKFKSLDVQEHNLETEYRENSKKITDQQQETFTQRNNVIGGYQGQKAKGLSYSGLGTDNSIINSVDQRYQKTIDEQTKRWQELKDEYHHERKVIEITKAILPLGEYLSSMFGVDVLDIFRGLDEDRKSNIQEQQPKNNNVNNEQVNNDDDGIDLTPKKKVINEG